MRKVVLALFALFFGALLWAAHEGVLEDYVDLGWLHSVTLPAIRFE